MLPWQDMLLLLEGQPVHFSAPKTHYAQDIVFDKDTPIFCTSKSEIISLRNGVVDDRETEMMAVRWRVFSLHAQILQEEQLLLSLVQNVSRNSYWNRGILCASNSSYFFVLKQPFGNEGNILI